METSVHSILKFKVDYNNYFYFFYENNIFVAKLFILQIQCIIKRDSFYRDPWSWMSFIIVKLNIIYKHF